MNSKKMIVLLMVASLMAGCADAIPDLPGTEEEVVVDWTTLNGEYTVLVDDDNNSTYSTVSIGTNNTWVIVNSFNYTATHLSFEIVNNTVIFNNYTWENDGHIHLGHSPDMGIVTLYFPEFPYDITVNYTVVYRTVNLSLIHI